MIIILSFGKLIKILIYLKIKWMIKIKYCFFKKLVNVLSSDYIMNLNNNTIKDKICFLNK